MPSTVHSLTFTAPDGTRQGLTYVTGHELVKRREQLAQLIAYGADPIDAYCEAYGKVITCDVDRRSFLNIVNVMLKDTAMKIRIQELRRPIQRKLARKWEYSLDRALEDCQQAYDVAYHDGDSKAMQSCIRLRAELTKLLSGDINVNHKHTVLDEETTEVLVALRDAVKRKKAAAAPASTPKVVNPEPEPPHTIQIS